MLGLDKLTFIAPERRQALQVLLTVIVLGMVTTGVITPEQQQHVFVLIALVAQIIAAVVNIVNLDPKAGATLLVAGLRRFIYTSAPIVAAAGAALGFFSESAVPMILTWASLILTALGAVIGIIFAVPVDVTPPEDDDKPDRA